MQLDTDTLNHIQNCFGAINKLTEKYRRLSWLGYLCLCFVSRLSGHIIITTFVCTYLHAPRIRGYKRFDVEMKHLVIQATSVISDMLAYSAT